MSIIIEALEEKRESIRESIYNYQSSIDRFNAELIEAMNRKEYLKALSEEFCKFVEKVNPKKIKFESGLGSLRERVDIPKEADNIRQELYRQYADASKKVKDLPSRKQHWIDSIAELMGKIEEIDREIEKQKKT